MNIHCFHIIVLFYYLFMLVYLCAFNLSAQGLEDDIGSHGTRVKCGYQVPMNLTLVLY